LTRALAAQTAGAFTVACLLISLGCGEPAAPRLRPHAYLSDALADRGDDRAAPASFGDTRRELTSVALAPGESIEWRRSLPSGVDALILEARAEDGPSALSVELRDAQGALQELALVALPARGGELPQVESLRISLGAWAGDDVTLDFRAGPDAGVVLGNPTILERAATALPPVVIICIDTLRRDHVDPYRQPGDEAELLTPALASLARDGIVFERAVASSSWTLPSVATLMTGLAPSVHQAGRRITVESDVTLEKFHRYQKIERGFVRFFDGEIYRLSRLRSDVDTLAELLRQTHLTHASNSNIALSQIGNVLNQGFDSHFYQSTLAAAEVTSATLDFAQAHADAQLFLYAHYIEPHEWPYRKVRARQETDRERVRRAYGLLVKQVDREVGVLLDGLRELGLYDPALVVFYADHGEHFWDDASQKLHGHGHTMHHIAIEVPLLVKLPGGALAGTVVDAPVKLADVYATVLEATSIPAREQGAYDPRSLRATAAGAGEDLAPRRIVSEYNAKGVELASILMGEHKAILDRKNGYWQLRLGATDEVLDPHGEETKELFVQLRGALHEHDAWGERHGTTPEAIEVTAEEMENLRQLGYIQDEADAPGQ